MSKEIIMREHKYKGKSIENGNWVYGNLIICDSYKGDDAKITLILPKCDYTKYFNKKAVEVIPETVCQFTGLYDKNEKQIYEGDVVKLFYYDGNSKDQLGKVKGIDNIIFVDGCFKLENETKYHPIGYDILGKCRFTEVIGNIHESVVSL